MHTWNLLIDLLKKFGSSPSGMISPLRHGAIGLALVSFSVSAQAPLDVRVALVIGNSAYPAGAGLVNPTNDARSIANTLKPLGFDVTMLLDATRSQVLASIDKVRDSLVGKQGVALLYYAGHGLQQNWHNYLVPVDAHLRAAGDVPQQTVDVESVMAAFKQADIFDLLRRSTRGTK